MWALYELEIRFADDIALISNNANVLQELLNIVGNSRQEFAWNKLRSLYTWK